MPHLSPGRRPGLAAVGEVLESGYSIRTTCAQGISRPPLGGAISAFAVERDWNGFSAVREFCYNINMQRPIGVIAIALAFAAASIYLGSLAVIMLLSPGAVPLSLGAPLLHGLEISGPYTFLLTATLAAIVAFGLFRLKNLARRAAIAICFAGMIMLIPKVSEDAATFGLRFFTAGAMLVVRMMIVWYLWQHWTAEKFH